MTGRITEARMYKKKKNVEGLGKKINTNMRIISLGNGDWNVCHTLYGRQDKKGKCSLKNSCPGYNPGCPQYELPTIKE